MKKEQGDRKFSQVLKWVGYATAILSLGGAVAGIVRFVYGRAETHRKVAALISAEAVQLQSRDYESAWRSLEQAAQLLPDARKVRDAQESLAMAWLENVHLHENQKFSDVTQKLEPILTRAVAASGPGPRRADLRAHLGWVYFLETRDGRFDLDPAGPYAEAVQEDHNNPYAQAMWGFWVLWQHCDRVNDGEGHFAAALISRREEDYVRELQLAALLNCNDEQSDAELIRVANAMRGEQKIIDEETRWRIWPLYYFHFARETPEKARFIHSVAPAEHLATFHWLFDALPLSDSDRFSRMYYLAVLQEAAGLGEDALANYRAVLKQTPPDGGSRWQGASAGAKRLSRSQ